MLAAAFGAPMAYAELDDPIESGREALDPWDEYPWYDEQADDVRPVNVREPEKVTPSENSPVEPRGSGGAEAVAWVIIGVVVVGLVVLLVYAVLKSDTPQRKDRSRESKSGGVDLAALPVPVAAAEGDLLAEAQRCYQRGEYGRAMIYLYSHLLLRLDKGQLIRLAKGKTNRQYLREIGGRGSLVEYFARAIETFESAFFGRRELARDEFESAWRGVDDFERSIDEGHA